MQQPPVKILLEAAIMASDSPINIERLAGMFADQGDAAPSHDALQSALAELVTDYAERGIELAEVGGGWRFQTRANCAAWINRLWEERKPRYSRALLETLAIIAYRQPITRAEIEDIRGVAVSSGIIKTLHERDWIKAVGHRDVPGRPAIFATTREFLAYFNLSSLSDLPTLAELRDIDELSPDLFADFEAQAAEAEAAAQADAAGDGELTPGLEAEGASKHPAAAMPAGEPVAGDASVGETAARGEPPSKAPGDEDPDDEDPDDGDPDDEDPDDEDPDDEDPDDGDPDDEDPDDGDPDDEDSDDEDSDDEDSDDEEQEGNAGETR
jgi:segregation and condensation protein B